MDNNILQQHVRIEHESHVYTDVDGNTYFSTTKFLGLFQEKADFNMLAGQVAKKRDRIFRKIGEERKMTIEQVARLRPKYERGYTKAMVQSEWDAKRDDAIEAGSHIHDKVELAGVTGKVHKDQWSDYYRWFMDEFKDFKLKYHEQVVYIDYRGLKIAGMIDFCHFRRGFKSMINIRDFKTNDYKTDTTKHDSLTGEYKNYDRNMVAPLEHLEDCDMTKYILQQSMYALMLEFLGFKVGNLGIIRMPWQKVLETPQYHLFGFMKLEIIAMLDYYVDNLQTNTIFEDEPEEGWVQTKL